MVFYQLHSVSMAYKISYLKIHSVTMKVQNSTPANLDSLTNLSHWVLLTFPLDCQPVRTI